MTLKLSDILGDNFDVDAAASAEQPEFEKLPEGEYKVLAESIEVRATKDGEGDELKIKFTVAEGPHSGSVLFDNPVLRHPKAGRQFYGRKRFAQLCKAAGFASVSNEQDLVGVPVMCYVIHDGTYQNVSEYWEVPKRAARPPAAPAGRAPAGRPTAPPAPPRPSRPASPQQAAADADFDDDINF